MRSIGSMCKNKLIIAAAGSGKTTFLVEQAKKIKDKNVLITTYTEANESELRKKFGGRIPKNVTIQTWFSFLLQHGVRPYQSILNEDLYNKKIGFYLTEEKSGKKYNSKGEPIMINNPKTGKEQPIYWGEKDFFHYFFTKDLKLYSDKTSKFIIDCNKKIKGEIIKRITRIYPHIYIDEIQDLAGWELQIIKLLFNSKSNILLVGDPRQVTYLTNHSSKYGKYKDGRIKEFVENECNKKKEICCIDETTLQKSHRNNKSICDFSSALYPNYPVSVPCECSECRNNNETHQGVFLIKKDDVDEYLNNNNSIIQLRWNILTEVNPNFECYNFGISKGKTFDRVLIYPTTDMQKWIKNSNYNLKYETRAKFYVALTRARYSVGIVFDYDDNVNYVTGLIKFKANA